MISCTEMRLQNRGKTTPSSPDFVCFCRRDSRFSHATETEPGGIKKNAALLRKSAAFWAKRWGLSDTRCGVLQRSRVQGGALRIRARKNLFDVLGIDEFRNFQDFVHLDEVGIRDIVEVNDVFGVASIAKGAFGELIDVVA